jgi:hypothetical protein
MAGSIQWNHRFDVRVQKKNRNRNIWNKDSTSSTMKLTLYCYAKKSHVSSLCPEKDRDKKEEWTVKKAMLHMHAKSDMEFEEKDKEITMLMNHRQD